jgi:signal transduction histidine kinase
MGAAELKALSSVSSAFAWSLEAAYLRSEQTRLRGEFERARSELARAKGLEALGRSTSEIIHELRNLLTVVVGESDLLALESLSDTARSSISNIACAARDGCNVIARLQSTVRGLPANETESIDLHGLLTEVLLVSRVRIASAKSSAGISVALNGMAGQMVVGVASELREVFSNLVANAIDAMPNGGALSVTVSKADGQVMVSVSDTGHGMSEDIRARVMEPFFTTKGSRGNGLGLAIVQGILTKHGGTIEVQSELGVGSTFVVRLPQARADLGTAGWLENTVVDSSRG